ncbi:3752_t:CDS:2 [Gigaspora rosea]|nr:3752_t:CDS:2 [Gigaspora rosea]
MHLKLANEMEMELIRNNGRSIPDDNDSAQFAIAISNPIVDHNEVSSIHVNKLSDITNLNISCYCGICSKTGYNSRTYDMNNCEDDYSEHENENTSQCCGICGYTGYNSCTCTSQDGYDMPLLVVGHNNEVDINNDNKSRHCGTCSKASHNASTCNTMK